MYQDMNHPRLDLEYEQINENFRFLADVRFKLLALVPALGGSSVFVLAKVGFEAGEGPTSSHSLLLAVVIVSLVGFFATLGITLYDQRNSELYNALIHRAKHLENMFGVPSTPRGLIEGPHGGQFNERPTKHRRVIFKAGHDLGLALIYGPLLGAWFFPLSYAVVRLAHVTQNWAEVGSVAFAALAGVTFTAWLVAIDAHEKGLYDAAARRDKDSVERMMK